MQIGLSIRYITLAIDTSGLSTDVVATHIAWLTFSGDLNEFSIRVFDEPQDMFARGTKRLWEKTPSWDLSIALEALKGLLF